MRLLGDIIDAAGHCLPVAAQYGVDDAALYRYLKGLDK